MSESAPLTLRDVMWIRTDQTSQQNELPAPPKVIVQSALDKAFADVCSQMMSEWCAVREEEDVKQAFIASHYTDANGNPAGGVSGAVGIEVTWQDGPLGRGADRQKPNGAFVETLIDIARDRLDFYQQGKFACEENATAMQHLSDALAILESRTAEREARGVEGTHAE